MGILYIMYYNIGYLLYVQKIIEFLDLTFVLYAVVLFNKKWFSRNQIFKSRCDSLWGNSLIKRVPTGLYILVVSGDEVFCVSNSFWVVVVSVKVLISVVLSSLPNDSLVVYSVADEYSDTASVEIPKSKGVSWVS